MNVIVKVGKFIFSLVTHLLAIGVVLLFFYPIASWYYHARPLFGIDFYNTVSLVTELTKNLVFPAQAWLSSWSGGWPFISQYPVLHFYAILPFTFFASVIDSTLMWMVITSALSFLGMYFLFARLSSSKLIATILAIGAVYSAGVYGALLWGGGLPYYATQAFYPWVLWFVVSFIKTGNRRFFWGATILAGLAIWGHPQAVLIYIVPTAIFLLISGSSPQYPFLRFKKKIGYVIVFTLLTFLIGLPIVYQTFGKALTRVVVVGDRESAISTLRVSAKDDEVAAFHRKQPGRIYVDSHPLIFVALVVTTLASVVGFLLKPRRTFFGNVLPFVFLAGGYVVYIHLYAYDISIYHGGWYRLFWSVPVWLGTLSSALWYELDVGLRQSFFKKIAPLMMLLLSSVGTTIIYIMGNSLPLLTPVGEMKGIFWDFVTDLKSQKLTPGGARVASWLPFMRVEEFIHRTSSEGRAALSSAYPMGLNIYPLDEKLRLSLLPTFLELEVSNKYRLYSADATFNIAWSSYSNIPNARGYLDTPIADSERGYLFWLDAAVNVDPTRGSSSLVTAFGYPEKVAVNHALFLLDWNGIRYFQGGGGGSSYSSPINELINNSQFIKTTEDVNVSADFPIPALQQQLRYLELKPELTSPIIMGTNAPVVGIVASSSGFEAVVRSLAATNLNSQILIPLNLGKFVDKISDNDLKAIDLLILYDYDYTNASGFRRISEYLKNGGRVFIDSGVETKQTDNRKLETPDFFPFKTLVREGLGSDWNLEATNQALLAGVDLANFSPPLFDETLWKMAYPPKSETRQETEVWLTHQGKPILTVAAYGLGKVVWTGLNLFYHVTRYNNLDEGILLKNILTQMIDLNTKSAIDVTVDRKISRLVTVTGQGMKGILFKEQFYPGWQASIKSGSVNQPFDFAQSQNAKIYKVGPTIPGYIYLPLPKNIQDQKIVVTFTYQGSHLMWGLLTISLIICLFLIDLSVFNGLGLGRLSHRMYLIFKSKTTRWWEKEDEDSQ